MTQFATSHLPPPNAPSALVLGLGVSGLALVRWWVRGGGTVTVADSRAAPPELAQLTRELPAVRFVGGATFDAALFDSVQPGAVFKSPGLTPESIAPLAQRAQAQGVPMSGELGLFAEALAQLQAQRAYRPTVLAVTGTNGKTTVTALTGRLLEAAGKRVAVAGNIGPSLLDSLTARLDADDLPDVWMLELSSFQLDAAGDFEPTAAALLNLTQDHLDWHGSMDAYAAAKARIFGRRALRVLNRDDAGVFGVSRPIAAAAAGKKPARRVQPPAVIGFGSDVPSRAGDFGIDTVHGVAWLVRAVEDETAGSPSRRRTSTGGCADLKLQRLLPADALRIRGRHNALNALAALALASVAGANLAPMLHALRDYRGEPHRVESVGWIDNVEYFDDSKGTNVGATVAALNGLGAERKLVVILGGDGKDQDFSPLVQPVARHARAVVLIGRDAPLLDAQLRLCSMPLLIAASMESAVALAAEHAHAGDAVLLSPACASFDMFRNYQHRAEAFCAAVAERALERGIELVGVV